MKMKIRKWERERKGKEKCRVKEKSKAKALASNIFQRNRIQGKITSSTFYFYILIKY